MERKIHFFAMDLPHSDACFVQAYPAETAEAFCDGHNAGFAFFGKVPRSILYDNTTLAVARILGDGVRQRTRVFSELQSHYVFADRFGRPGKGNDKGKVEGLIGWVRRNLLVPVPRATLLHGSAGVAGQGSIGAGWNPVNNRKPHGAIQTPRRAPSSYPKTALSGHERAGI